MYIYILKIFKFLKLCSCFFYDIFKIIKIITTLYIITFYLNYRKKNAECHTKNYRNSRPHHIYIWQDYSTILLEFYFN